MATKAATVVCRDCGDPFERPAKRGRPPVRCEKCRADVATSPAMKSLNNSRSGLNNSPSPVPAAAPVAAPPGARRNGPMTAYHRFKVDPHPAAWRWCAMCGLPKERHPEGRVQ